MNTEHNRTRRKRTNLFRCEVNYNCKGIYYFCPGLEEENLWKEQKVTWIEIQLAASTIKTFTVVIYSVH